IGVKNVGSFSDTFTLTLMSNEWPAALGVTQTQLAPNEWLTVPLTVSIPLTAPVDGMDFVMISAIGSHGSPAVAVVQTIVTMVYDVFLPVALGGED
ncbi:MAG: hypothetical protein HY870_01555, partial [Chloroflexi bacterium]|nr:hypothetical protein [Chloroflexota bacterium]